MKKNSCLVMILIFLAIKTEAQQWNLVWSDEFTNSSINASNWVFETGGGGWGNNELENYTNRPVNATVYNGNLIIVARKESYNGSNYTSTRMKTQGKQSWTYGKVEARMKLPLGKGIWPAFWMLGDNISTVGWPSCGEIDIMEHINTETKTYGTIHWDNNGHAQYGGNTTVNANQYHVYAIEWDSLNIKWFLDGTQFWTASIANNINSTNEFHMPQFILLNMAVGGTWPGNPDGTTVFPDTMFVDYVRVYKKAMVTSAMQNERIREVDYISPNPAIENSTIYLEDGDQGEYRLTVYDVLGKVCFQKRIVLASNEIRIDFPVNDLRPGIYFVNVSNAKKSTTLKLIKR